MEEDIQQAKKQESEESKVKAGVGSEPIVTTKDIVSQSDILKVHYLGSIYISGGPYDGSSPQ